MWSENRLQWGRTGYTEIAKQPSLGVYCIVLLYPDETAHWFRPYASGKSEKTSDPGDILKLDLTELTNGQKQDVKKREGSRKCLQYTCKNSTTKIRQIYV